MTETYPRPPKGKTRIIIRTQGGEVLIDMLLDEGSINAINLPNDHGLHLTSVTQTQTGGKSR